MSASPVYVTYRIAARQQQQNINGISSLAAHVIRNKAHCNVLSAISPKHRPFLHTHLHLDIFIFTFSAYTAFLVGCVECFNASLASYWLHRLFDGFLDFLYSTAFCSFCFL